MKRILFVAVFFAVFIAAISPGCVTSDSPDKITGSWLYYGGESSSGLVDGHSYTFNSDGTGYSIYYFMFSGGDEMTNKVYNLTWERYGDTSTGTVYRVHEDSSKGSGNIRLDGEVIYSPWGIHKRFSS